MTTISLPERFPFDDSSLPYRVEPMRVSDLDEVMRIEHVAFPAPWPVSAYRYELTQNELSLYLVLRPRRRAVRKGWKEMVWLWKTERPPVLGYGGFWTIVDEAHISTIAIHPDWRGRGLGEFLLVGLIDAAILRGAKEVTLEVRESNVVAQNLYRKYGFVQVGRRKGYYHDNNEDALIMTTPPVDGPAYQDKYVVLRDALRRRLSDQD